MISEKVKENSSDFPEGADNYQDILEELVKAGVLYGRKKSKTHPKMKKHIFATRNGFEIIDIVQTLKMIELAEEFLKEKIRHGGSVMFVGTTPAAGELVKSLSSDLNYPYVVDRWLGGTLTNFKTLYQRIQYYIKLKSDRDLGRLEKYTKKERSKFDKEIERLNHLFGGLEKMTKLPEVLIVLGVSSHLIAIKEAKKMNIPVIGLVSSDADPNLVDFPIPANDRAKSSIAWILERLSNAIKEGKRIHIEKKEDQEIIK